MHDHVRWGVLGASRFAAGTMAPAINEARRGRLAALATRDLAKAQAFADLAPGLTIHDSYEALLADPDIDAVYIPLPNALHVPWSVRAAEAGKAVLCEKPIALEEADFDRLIATRDKTGRLIAEGFMPVHHPQWIRTRELIAAGDIGTLHTITGVFTFGLGTAPNIRLDADLGGGALRDIGVYPLGMARFATDADATMDWAETQVEHGVDTSAWVQGRMAGARLSFHVSMRGARRQEMVFEGTEGWLRLPAPFNPGIYGEAEVILRRDDRDDRIIRYPRDRQYVLQVEAFNATLLDGAPYACPLEFSRGTQKGLEAVFAVANSAPHGL